MKRGTVHICTDGITKARKHILTSSIDPSVIRNARNAGRINQQVQRIDHIGWRPNNKWKGNILNYALVARIIQTFYISLQQISENVLTYVRICHILDGYNECSESIRSSDDRKHGVGIIEIKVNI